MPEPAPAPDRRPSPWRWWVCVLLLLASALNYMDRMALNQTAVRIKSALGIDDQQYGLIESAFAVAFALGTLFTGWLVDKVNVRWVYPAAVLGWSAFGFLTGFAQGYWALLGFRLGLGFFEAGNWPCGIRTTRQMMPPAERSLGNAFFQNGTAIGAVVTPLIVLACMQWADPREPERSAHLAVAGGLGAMAAGLPPDGVWQVPFRVIGAIGLVWVLLWVLTVPKRVLSQTYHEPAAAAAGSFGAVVRDRRFWLLIAVIIGVNTSWHTFRVWLPPFLQERHGYSEADMSYTMMAYYLCADAGAWAVGFATVGLVRAGRTVHSSRLLTFAGCTALLAAGVAVPFLDRGPMLTAALLVHGFAALGLFPTYFALSQDLSARHQGKVTGTLGCINGLYLAGMFWAEGAVVKGLGATPEIGNAGKHTPIFIAAGLPALLALILVALFWRPKPN